MQEQELAAAREERRVQRDRFAAQIAALERELEERAVGEPERFRKLQTAYEQRFDCGRLLAAALSWPRALTQRPLLQCARLR
jgi:hypothetical protein